MKKNELKQPVTQTAEYNFDMLLNDILDCSNEVIIKKDVGDKAKREFRAKLIIIQMLIGLADTYKTEDYNDDDMLNNAINVKVNGNELLSGYMFYVSQNRQFDYSWNYMRKREESFKEFLADSVRFLKNMIEDIKIITERFRVGNDFHIVFNNIFDVAMNDNEKSCVRTRVLWENFHHIISVRRDYYICVKIKESVLVTGRRTKSNDAVSLFDMAQHLAKSIVKDTE